MRVAAVLLIPAFILTFTGCATGNKNQQIQETARLNAQVSDLEEQLKQKDEEIKMLEDQLRRDSTMQEDSIEKPAAKSTPKRIQQALKNAGLYKGKVDGKVGKRTRDAIKAFQRANGLNADGVVGSQTWAKLSAYL